MEILNKLFKINLFHQDKSKKEFAEEEFLVREFLALLNKKNRVDNQLFEWTKVHVVEGEGRVKVEEIFAIIQQILRLLNKIMSIENLDRLMLRRIVNNFISEGKESEHNITASTTNTEFIESYRSASALKSANELLTEQFRELPGETRRVLKNSDRYKQLKEYEFKNLERLEGLIRKLRINLLLQKRFLTKLKSSDYEISLQYIKKIDEFKTLVAQERHYCFMINHLFVNFVKEIMIAIKLINSTRILNKRKRLNKCIVIVFGGMEKRFQSLIYEVLSAMKKDFKSTTRKINNFIFAANLGDILDIYFIICLGPEPCHYSPYYYTPTALEACNYIKKNISSQQELLGVFLFGICGSFTDQRGKVYLPNEFKSLFYDRSEKVTEKEINELNKGGIKIKNRLVGIVEGETNKTIVTCSSLYNSAIIQVNLETRSLLAKTKILVKQMGAKIPGLKRKVRKTKEKKLLAFSQRIRDQKMADGVEMESFIIAREFGNQAGIFLEVSDNVIQGEPVSFDMRTFNRAFKRYFIPTISQLIEHEVVNIFSPDEQTRILKRAVVESIN